MEELSALLVSVNIGAGERTYACMWYDYICMYGYLGAPMYGYAYVYLYMVMCVWLCLTIHV